MILEKMISLVESGIQDPSYTLEDDILPLINEALDDAAERFCHADLAKFDTVTILADAAGPVSLPNDYHHDLYRVVNTTFNRPVSIRSNLAVLESLYDGMTSPGPVQDVAVEGNELFFKPSPAMATDQVLTLFYYKKIEEFEEGDTDEEPTWIPDRFHRGIVVDYVLKELWALVEDGIDGHKVNTAFYEARHAQALVKLERHTRKNPKQKPVIVRTVRFF